MLSKKVCKFCYEKHGVKWTAENDKWWSRGCLSKGGAKTFSEALKDCPYALEHKMETQKC